MTSLRDAHKRLEIIYAATSPEVQDQNAADAGLEEFERLKKKCHNDLKGIRQALKDRDMATARGGNTAESAEASYRIRVMIKSVKENVNRMEEIYQKKARRNKNGTDPAKTAKLNHWKDVVELGRQHLEEVEGLEKKRINDMVAADRVDLLGNAKINDDFVHIPQGGDAIDPYASELPDLDVTRDLEEIKNRDQEIDKDVMEMSKGIGKLKEIAIDMGQELEQQQEQLTRVDQKAEDNLDHLDNLNVTLKNAVDKMMKGDKFMVNCIVLSIVLALAAFIASQFLFN